MIRSATRCPKRWRAVQLLRPSVSVRFLLFPLLAACNGDARPLPPPGNPGYQAISFLGDTLLMPAMSEEARQRYQADLDEARAAYEHAPLDADSIIWYGRRLGYLGQYQEAIRVFSNGIQLHPDNAWLYRFRGHRYITVRRLNDAVSDLEKAMRLTADEPDIIEPDGQPNAKGVPVSTLQSNIRYHLALARYLQGNFEKAAEVAQEEVNAADNDDRRVAMTHWLYMSLRRMGRDSVAAAVLEPVAASMHVVENQVYHRLLLLYKGELPPDSLLTTTTEGQPSAQDAATAYGLGNWYWYNGQHDEARALWRQVVEAGQWAGFGAIAAEAELARLDSTADGNFTSGLALAKHR